MTDNERGLLLAIASFITDTNNLDDYRVNLIGTLRWAVEHEQEVRLSNPEASGE